MMEFIRTDSENTMFQALVFELDKELATIDGSEHSFYSQYNKIDKIQYAIVAVEGGTPVACGALRKFDENSMEVKRMFTLPQFRGEGIAARLLKELELWAAELGCSRCVLETGKRQPDAIRLYTKSGYWQIENYAQYAGVENSVCFEKRISDL